MAADRKYYRLDELEKLGVTEGALRYFIEQEKLQPVFFLPSEHYVLGGYHENKFKGFAIARYKGIVSIPSAKLAHLLSKGKVTSVEMTLLERENITVISSDYPFDVPLPNSYIASWLKADLAVFKWPAIPAKSYPIECDSFASSFIGALKAISSTAEKTAAKDIDSLDSKIFETHPRKVLSAEGQKFEFANICILASDLIRLGLLNVQIAASDTPAPIHLVIEPQLNLEDKFKNEFEELISRILKAEPQLQAKEIHRLLCSEAAMEESARTFDTRDVLMGETDGIISWRDKYRGNAERSYSLDSLRNVIIAVRKKL